MLDGEPCCLHPSCQAEIAVNLPRELELLEPQVRDAINQQISRGRLNVRVTFHSNGGQTSARMHLNTTVSSLMELVNELYAFSEGTAHGIPTRAEPAPGRIERPQTVSVLREAIDALVLMLAPFVPHTAEEMWAMLGHADGLSRAPGGLGGSRASDSAC